MSMSKKITKNNRFLIILFGMCACILLQKFVCPSLQLSAWDNENSSISQILDLDDEAPSNLISANFSFQTALFGSLLSSSRFNVYMHGIPQIVHGRSPPLS